MEKYCTLKKHFQEPSKPYNLISTSFFLTDNSYKDPVKKYVYGLKASVENFYLHFDKSYMMRIYFDNSVLEKVHKSKELNEVIDDIIPNYEAHIKIIGKITNISDITYDVEEPTINASTEYNTAGTTTGNGTDQEFTINSDDDGIIMIMIVIKISNSDIIDHNDDSADDHKKQ